MDYAIPIEKRWPAKILLVVEGYDFSEICEYVYCQLHWYKVFNGYLHKHLFDQCQIKTDLNFTE